MNKYFVVSLARKAVVPGNFAKMLFFDSEVAVMADSAEEAKDSIILWKYDDRVIAGAKEVSANGFVKLSRDENGKTVVRFERGYIHPFNNDAVSPSVWSDHTWTVLDALMDNDTPRDKFWNADPQLQYNGLLFLFRSYNVAKIRIPRNCINPDSELY